MLNRRIAFLLGLMLASLSAMGGALCAGKPDTTSCCCALAESPVSSPLMRMCCETACRKRPNDTPSTPVETAAQAPMFAVPLTPVRVEALEDESPALVSVTLKSVEAAVADQHLPDLFVRKQTFLI